MQNRLTWHYDVDLLGRLSNRLFANEGVGLSPGGVVEVFHDGSSHTAQLKDLDRARRYLYLS